MTEPQVQLSLEDRAELARLRSLESELRELLKVPSGQSLEHELRNILNELTLLKAVCRDRNADGL